MATFLCELAATNNVSAAAKSAGMSRQSAYRLRVRMKGSPFDVGWEAAFQHGYDNLAHAALDRALNGVEVPHYYKGELVRNPPNPIYILKSPCNIPPQISGGCDP